LTVRLISRLRDELDASSDHVPECLVEVVDTQEEPNSVCHLIADDGCLVGAVGLCQQ